MQNAAYLAILFGALAINDTFMEDKKKDKSYWAKGVVSVLPVLLAGVMSMAFIYNAFSYMYREANFNALTVKVTSGPYKGLYTTEERKEGVVALESYARKFTAENDLLLVKDTAPALYLMSGAKPCTPSTWDQELYSMGFDKPDLYYDYFAASGQEPTKIIYVNYGHYETMSIDAEHKFNQYVNDNFDLVYENRNIFTGEYYGRQVTGELLVFDRK